MPLVPRVVAASNPVAEKKKTVRVRVLFPHLLCNAAPAGNASKMTDSRVLAGAAAKEERSTANEGKQGQRNICSASRPDTAHPRAEHEARASSNDGKQGQRKICSASRPDTAHPRAEHEARVSSCEQDRSECGNEKQGKSHSVSHQGSVVGSGTVDQTNPINPQVSLPQVGIVGTEQPLTWDGLKLSNHDLSCLEDGSMLNDSVIDFFLRLIHRYVLPRQDIYVFPSLFFTRLTAAEASDGEIGWENVKSWTRRANLFSHKLAVVPINCELHWWLAVLQLGSSSTGELQVSMFWVDSLCGAPSRYDHAAHYLSGYLRREWAERSSDNSSIRASVRTPSQNEGGYHRELLPAPQQTNGVDCGVFLLENVVRLLAGTCSLSPQGGCTRSEQMPWCDQSQAMHRRGCLRRTVHRLQLETSTFSSTSTAASGSASRGVPDLLNARPDLVKRLRCLWGLPTQFLAPSPDAKAAEAAGGRSKRANEACMEDPASGLVKRSRHSSQEIAAIVV